LPGDGRFHAPAHGSQREPDIRRPTLCSGCGLRDTACGRVAAGARALRGLCHPLAAARANALKLDWGGNYRPTPPRAATTTLRDFSLSELVPFIDWSPFFSTWELTGKFPAILDDDKYGAAARALFDDKKREQVRARARSRGQGMYAPISPLPTMQPFQPYPRIGGPTTSLSPIPAGAPTPYADSRYASAIREAESDHREIHRQLLNMPPDEQEQIPEVAASADAVFRKVQQLALSLSDMDRSTGRESAEQVEKEITTLESQANPLDYNASEGRVRRLAMLRRQRRALVEIGRKKKEAQDKLDNCRQLLRSMRMELVRFRTGGLNAQPTGLTMVTQQAQSVVREMGYLSDANAELNAL